MCCVLPVVRRRLFIVSCFLRLVPCFLFPVSCLSCLASCFLFFVSCFLFLGSGFWFLVCCGLLAVSVACLGFAVCCPLCVVCCWLLCVVCYWVTQWYTGTRLVGKKKQSSIKQSHNRSRFMWRCAKKAYVIRVAIQPPLRLYPIAVDKKDSTCCC